MIINLILSYFTVADSIILFIAYLLSNIVIAYKTFFLL